MVQKTGRNELCPCGSGIKYKKCCLAKDEDHARAARATSAEDGVPFTASDDDDDWAVDDVGGPQLTPYQLGKLAEQERYRQHLGSRYLAKLEQRWLPSKMAALGTEEILERLGRCGIVTSADRFREMAREHESAWLLAEGEWFPVARKVVELAEDFWCFAACELWKRWLPDLPSTEMRDDLMIEGRTFSENRNRDPVKACDLWLRAWEWVRPHLTPDMRSMEDAQELIGDVEFMGNWIDDLADALRDAAHEDRHYAELGLRFCEQVLAQFTDDDNEFIRCQVGDFLFFLGERERGESIFTALIEERPNESVGYARLADALTFIGPTTSADLERAISVVEQALAHPVEDADDWDLRDRLVDLRARLPAAIPD